MASEADEPICDFLSGPDSRERVYSRWGRVGSSTVFAPNEHAEEELAPGDLRCILAGWAVRQKVLRDGRRVVRNFLIPGDVVGHWKDAWPRAFTDVLAATELTCATIGAQALERDREQREKVRAHLEAALVTETALLNGVVLRLGGMTVAERLVHLFLELLERHRRAGLGTARGFHLPVSQELVADSLGISRVHLNRTLGQLRRDGLVRLEAGFLELTRVPELIRLVDYERLYPDSRLD